MSCKEVKSVTYQTRKSPAFHARDCKGIRKKGKDGIYLSQPDKHGVYKWIKISKKAETKKQKGTFYDIHDNGGTPFRVNVNGSTVRIYKGENRELIHTFKAKQVHLGGKGKGAGNSILLHLSGNQYVYIGSEIYEFQMEDTVDSYFSMIGNSDVPYPILLGTTYVYFMLDHCYAPRSSFSPSMTKKQWEDAYAYYYGHIDPMTHSKGNGKSMSCKKMKGVHVITKRVF